MLYKDFILPTKLSMSAIARAINISEALIHRIMRGEDPISIETDLRLCKFFGVEDGYFFKMQQPEIIMQKKAELKSELDKIQLVSFYENKKRVTKYKTKAKMNLNNQ